MEIKPTITAIVQSILDKLEGIAVFRDATKTYNLGGQANLGSAVVVLMPDTYVSISRTYKVLSASELDAIARNSSAHLSPFEKFYVTYRKRMSDSGSWVVTYYYVDTLKVTGLAEYGLVLLFDDLVAEQLEQMQHGMRLETPLGTFAVVTSNSQKSLTHQGHSALKSYLLRPAMDNTNWILSQSDVRGRLFAVLGSFQWLRWSHALNYELFKSYLPKLSMSRQEFSRIAAVLGGAVILESALLGLGAVGQAYYLDVTKAEREEYSAKKSAYLQASDQHSDLLEMAESHSDMRYVPSVLAGVTSTPGLRLEAVAYSDGSLRLTGLTDDVAPLMNQLGIDNRVGKLEFVSPISPDRSGRDRFNIEFEITGNLSDE